jgi:hypothetical protein
MVFFIVISKAKQRKEDYKIKNIRYLLVTNMLILLFVVDYKYDDDGFDEGPCTSPHHNQSDPKEEEFIKG